MVIEEAAAVLPTLDFAVRHGVNGKADFGLTMGSVGLMFDYKAQLMRSETMAIAIDPAFGGFVVAIGGAGGGVVNAAFPLILGFNLGPATELTVAPRISYQRIFAQGEGESAALNTVLPGISVGLTQEFSRTFRIHPELSVAIPAVSGATSTGESGSGGGTPVFNLGVGIAFGGGYANRQYTKP